MESENSDVMIKIIYIGVFLAVVLLAVIVTIAGLNSGNHSQGQSVTQIVTGETIYNAGNQTSMLLADNLTDATCEINSVSNNGYVLDSSYYTVNNCQLKIIK